MTLFEIASLFENSCPNDAILSGICIDSRRVMPGNLFIAIKGENFDGHQFVHEVAAQGAAAIVCSRVTPGITIPQLLVPDTTDALAMIAAHHRRKQNCAIIALTGSNGKTTVKEMIASILPDPSFATPGNLNNHIGAPLSVLKLQPEHRYAVFELGANHSGEIAHTVAIVQPQVTLINNIGSAHLEGFGSIDGIANAKGEIHQGLAEGGIAVINDDDAYAHYWETLLVNKKTVRFSAINPTDIYARDVVLNADGCAQFVLVTPLGETFVQLAVPGMHNVSNALAACACAYALGIGLPEIKVGLLRFTGVAGRLAFLPGKNDALIIDDTYNANLRSVLASIEVLAARKGTRIFVFGDMGEIGACSEQHHKDVGVAAQRHGIDYLLTCGKHSEATTRAFGVGGKHYPSQNELISDLLQLLGSQTTVLVKGSRSSAMEHVVSQLIKR